MEPVSRDDLTLGSNAVLISTVVDECESNHKVHIVSLEKLCVPVGRYLAGTWSHSEW